jgi:hypothetical protein
MQVLNLTLRGVEVFIERSKTKNQESYWDNYDLMIWKSDNSGFTNIKGLFRKDTWGIAERISVDEQGIWKLPGKYVKHFK